MLDHTVVIVDLPTTEYGYGDMAYASSDRYVICSCGNLQVLVRSDSDGTKDGRFYTLEHLVDALMAERVAT